MPVYNDGDLAVSASSGIAAMLSNWNAEVTHRASIEYQYHRERDAETGNINTTIPVRMTDSTITDMQGNPMQMNNDGTVSYAQTSNTQWLSSDGTATITTTGINPFGGSINYPNGQSLVRTGMTNGVWDWAYIDTPAPEPRYTEAEWREKDRLAKLEAKKKKIIPVEYPRIIMLDD